MSPPAMVCPGDAASVAMRYARGDSGPDVDAFEPHMLTCASCQGLVRLAAAVAAAAPAAPATPVSPPGRRTGAGHVVAAALVAAVVLVVVWPRDAVRRLGRVDAPVGAFAQVRGAAGDIADSGLAALAAGDARRAAQYLSRAFDANPAPGIAFYLGFAYVRSNAPSDALHALDVVVRAPFNAFTTDAEYLRAKAWLQLGDAESALRALSPSRSSPEPRTAPGVARNVALADSISRVLR